MHQILTHTVLSKKAIEVFKDYNVSSTETERKIHMRGFQSLAEHAIIKILGDVMRGIILAKQTLETF